VENYLKGKKALITGAGDGIGKATAYELAKLGVDLLLVSKSKNKLENLANELSSYDILVEILPLDVQDKNQVQKSLSGVDIDILVNSAGLALGLEPFYKGDSDDWDKMIDTNIKGVLYVTKAVIDSMIKKETAHIINLGSVAGKMAYPNGAVYCATKSAIHSLSEGMNADLLRTNVKVTTIAPGAVETNFSNVRFKGDEQRAKSVYKGFKPLSAKDIAKVIINILNTPAHVNIQYVDIMPTAQRNPYLLFKNE
jgi:NADP-dependent 3-hydroxy acid dehydrogenase YdfG